ncbi:MAG: FKBP-type peptidyl-prolyl cis-trans isomerase [Prevotellaceae bacterium]|jgi:FKBP-type peptidyl-prolyl cis-trans isomerase FklB|nr:FKBP-type peptidyl-prolyl cis-trans isomerase [Prevotellaceae bacterium]
MKKAILHLPLLIIAGIMSGCNEFTAKAPDLDSATDSLNYVTGLIYGDQVSYELFSGHENDEEGIKSFFIGMREGFKDDFNEETIFPYMSGVNLGVNVKIHEISGIFGDSSIIFDRPLLAQGVIDGLHGETPQMTPEEAERYLNAIFNKKQQHGFRAAQRQLEKTYKANKEAGEAYLRENGKKAGVVITPSGLQYKVLERGDGPHPQANDIIRIHCKVSTVDGTVLRHSITDTPFELQANSFINGWTEAFLQMSVGSKWLLYIPYNLAYGAYSPTDEIKPFSALICEIELLSIVTD